VIKMSDYEKIMKWRQQHIARRGAALQVHSEERHPTLLKLFAQQDATFNHYVLPQLRKLKGD